MSSTVATAAKTGFRSYSNTEKVGLVTLQGILSFEIRNELNVYYVSRLKTTTR